MSQRQRRRVGLQVPRLVASYQANFVNGALFFMMCAIASGAAPVSCVLVICRSCDF